MTHGTRPGIVVFRYVSVAEICGLEQLLLFANVVRVRGH